MNRVGALFLSGLAALALQGQSTADHPVYVRLSAVMPMGDLKAYLGDKTLVHAFEVGHDFKGPDDWAGLGLYATYLVANGSPITKYQGLKQSLYGWRVGGDVRFKTPVAGLTPFLGVSITAYDGKIDKGGVVPNYDTPSQPFQVPAGPYPEGKGKFGGRLGVEYRINKEWGLALDYSFSEWRSDFRLGTYTPITGHRVVNGLNPVNPSWIALSAQYRWSVW